MTDSQHLTNDPEILALLDFQAVPRRCKKEGGWTAEMQRLFIAKLAVHGSPGKACDELGMYRSGIDKVFKSEGAESFRAAWAAAVELADRGGSSASPPAMPMSRTSRCRSWIIGGKGRPRSLRTQCRESPLAVMCDKCACDKFAGIPYILAFDPVRMPFGDKGWDDERQRAFIAALAVTGSAGAAARSVGRHELGAERLRKMRGARGFSEAWDAALEIARDRQLVRLGGTLEGLSEGGGDGHYDD
jgi:hypothetical protein